MDYSYPLAFASVKRYRDIFLLTLFTLFFIFFSPAAQAQLQADFTADTLVGCPPVIVHFTDQSAGNPISWKWDFGNGGTSSFQNPQIVYDEPGTYAVTLTVNDGSHSDKIVKQAYITVSDTPSVSFLVSPPSGCYPLNVHFTDHSEAGTNATIKSWLWDFGDGNISHQPNPTHTYNNANKFNVTLSITNSAGCTSGITRQGAVVTNQGVKADFTADHTFSCTAPMTAHFNAQTASTQQVTWLWDFGDNSTGTGASPAHTYTQDGVYTVTLKASIVNGCTDTVVQKNLIHVGSFQSDFQLPQGCAKVPLTFKNTSSPLPDSAIWHFSDGTIIHKINAVHQFSQPGTYEITLVNIYEGGCKDSITKTLKTFPSAKAAFQSTIQKYCSVPAAVTFENLSQDITSAQWDFGDGGSSTQLQPTHTYKAEGLFDVKLTVKNQEGCVDSVVRTGYIRVSDPEVQFIANNNSGCVNSTVEFQNKVESVDPVTSYYWDFGDGSHSTAADPSHVYSKEGTYDVKLRVTTASGCTDSLVRTSFVHIGTPPKVNFSATPKSACMETPIQFTNLSAPEGQSWIWSFPEDGQTSDAAENPLHHFYHLGKQDVTLTVNNNGCEVSETKTDFVTIKAPKAMMGIQQSCADPYTVTFVDKSKSAEKWEWDFGDGSHYTGQNPPAHTYANTGTYKVILTAQNGECTSTISKTIHIIDLHPVLQTDANVICHGTKVHFSMAGRQDTTWVKSYTWVLGNGKSYTTVNPDTMLVYPKNGTYNARLITENINGCSDTSDAVQMTVQGPEADFMLSSSESCPGTEVTFRDNSTIAGAPLNRWEWDFGDSTTQTSNIDSVVHAYQEGGIYRVALTVTDANGCTDKRVKENAISVNAAAAAFSTVDSMICPGAPIKWVNSSKGNNLTFLWNFGDTTTSNQKTPSKTYLNEGTYSVALTVETPTGCRDSVIRENYIHVGKPYADMSYKDNNAPCPPFVVSVANLSKNYRKVEWDFGDGTISSNSDTAKHVYNIPGNYQLKLLVYGYSKGCMDSIIRTVHVEGPYGTGRIVDSVGCSPHAVRFSATAVNTVSYRWSFGDGKISDASSSGNATYTYKEAGIYRPKLILTDARGCNVSIPVKSKITVDGVDIDPVFTLPKVCDSSLLQFHTKGFIFSEDSLLMPAGYQWNFGEPGSPDNTSTNPEPQHDYTGPGQYPVIVRVNTAYGCQSEDTAQVIVPVPNIMQLTTSPDTAICNGMAALLWVTGGNRYVWTPASDLDNAESATPVATPAATTTYRVVGYSKGDCQSDTADIKVAVNQRPRITIPEDTTIGTGSSVRLPVSYSPDAISWDWNPVQYLSCVHCATPVSTPRKPMTYRVVTSNQWGCTDTASIEVHLVCKQGKVFIPNTFTPNNDGTNDIFYPRGKGVREVIYFRIYNRWGQLVYEHTHFQMNDRTAGWDGTLKGNKLPPGVFIYQTGMLCESGSTFKLSGNITLLR